MTAYQLETTKSLPRFVTLELTNDSLEMARLACLQVMEYEDEAFDVYHNPFEYKMTLKQKFAFGSSPLGNLLTSMEGELRYLAETLFDAKLEVDVSRHYASVFRYPKGSYLLPHVDAGLHPVTGQRKHITAVCYLSGTGHRLPNGGDLQFWMGDNCAEGEPRLRGPVWRHVEPKVGRVVLFENNDYAWHGMHKYLGEQERVVVTVSYLSDDVDRFLNQRTRAFFVPHPNKPWDEGTYQMRDMRADPDRYKDAYRTED
jgi:hypothetical protein